MAANPNRRAVAVDGLLLLNKPPGMTSNRALQKVKRLVQAKKAGHTGSLDPSATGMLPLCFGEATKVCAYLLDADKTYRVTARLGTTTDTGDADGKKTASADVPELSQAEWAAILGEFLGDSTQIPPMYSALKQDGRRLYELARKGEVVERQPRPLTIHEIQLLEVAGTRVVFRVRCSKGTYVRTLVEDIAKRAGTVAHTAKLHRESVAHFDSADMLDLDTLEKLAETGPEVLRALLLSPDMALQHMASVNLADDAAQRFRGGQSVKLAETAGKGLLRVYDAGGHFLGVGELQGGVEVAPRRVFRIAAKKP